MNLPARIDAGGDDVDIAVHSGASVALSSSATRDLCRGTYVDGHEHILQFGNFKDACGIGSELKEESTGSLAEGQDPRRGEVGSDVQG